MDINEKWINDYINDVDISKIEWVKFDIEQLMNFYDENYWDKDVWKYVVSDVDSTFESPIGLHYLNFNYTTNYSFLLGIVDNKINKKTIIAAMVYLENYYIFNNQQTPLTYMSTVETNSYFRNKGIYKKLCEVAINFLNPNQHILISKESDIGSKCQVAKKLKEALVEKGFKKMFWIFFSYSCYS